MPRSCDTTFNRVFYNQFLTALVGLKLVWDGLAFVPFETQSQCYDDVLLRQQLITVTVTSRRGEAVVGEDEQPLTARPEKIPWVATA